MTGKGLPMKKITEIFRNPLSVFFFSILLSVSCSTTQVDENDPLSLLKDAEEEIASDHYQIAIDKLKVIKNKFPYSKQAVTAHLRIADVYFLQESFGEAGAVYESFRDLHPKHEKTAYAMFRIGKSNYNDIPSPVARDLTPAYKAIEAYGDFLRRFPTATEAPEAKSDIAAARKILSEKELYIGDFYFKGKNYDSAKPRYKKILDLYSDTQAAEAAKKKLSEIEQKQSTEGSHADNRESSDSTPGSESK